MFVVEVDILIWIVIIDVGEFFWIFFEGDGVVVGKVCVWCMILIFGMIVVKFCVELVGDVLVIIVFLLNVDGIVVICFDVIKIGNLFVEYGMV